MIRGKLKLYVSMIQLWLGKLCSSTFPAEAGFQFRNA
jgi:hypothetical protein